MPLYWIRVRTVSVSLLRFRGAAARGVTTSAARRAKAAPTYEERLSSLKGAEKRVAVIAVGSMVTGYVALKMAFSSVAPKQSSQKKETESDSGTRIRQRRPLVVAGPSGSGKSTLLKLLFKEYPDDFGFSISHTTRKPREGEVDGREYHFTTREKMKKSIDAGDFIEWAEFSGNMYGTSVKAVQDVQVTGKVCVLDIDMQGVRSVKKTDLNPLYIYIKPPSITVLEKRLRGRNSESEESLRKRLDTAREEMEYADSPGAFDHVVVNDDLDTAYQTLKTTITENCGITEEQRSPK